VSAIVDRRPCQPARWRALPGLAGGLVLALAAASPVLAHGAVPDEPPSIAGLLLGWSFEPLLALPLLAAALAWLRLVGRVNRRHPDNPVPRSRSAAFLGGLLAIALALQSGIERYDTALFSVHMVQHLLLTLVAAPLLALGAPVTLLLRVAGSGDRRRWILPALHSRAARVVGHPVVAALVFAGVMWGTHFSPLFDASLEDRLAHDLEHLLFLGAALLFWWPAVGLDPGPYRLSHPSRILYTFLQMPQNTFLAVAILYAPAPLYPHYATLAASWLPDPLADQQLAAGIMWLGGDLLFLTAIFAIVLGWSRREDRDVAAAERRADLARAEIRAREVSLAARHLREQPGPGSAPAPGAEARNPEINPR
jgi:putative copper resistance protein D